MQAKARSQKLEEDIAKLKRQLVRTTLRLPCLQLEAVTNCVFAGVAQRGLKAQCAAAALLHADGVGGRPRQCGPKPIQGDAGRQQLGRRPRCATVLQLWHNVAEVSVAGGSQDAAAAQGAQPFLGTAETATG